MVNYDIELYKEHLFCLQNARERVFEVTSEHVETNINWLIHARFAAASLDNAIKAIIEWIETPKQAQRKETLRKNMF